MKRQRLRVNRVADALRKTSGMVAMAAQSLGCARQTVYTFIKEHPQLEEIIEEERERLVDLMELQFKKLLLEGNERILMFGLRTKGKDRGWGERLEHSFQVGPVNSWQDIADAGITREEALADTLRLFGTQSLVGEVGLNGSNGKNKQIHQGGGGTTDPLA